jgi:hypothetical protein
LLCTFYVPGIFKHHTYSETSLNRPSLNIGRSLKSLLNNSLQRKSHKTGHSSKPTIFFGPSAGRLKELSLYMLMGITHPHSSVIFWCPLPPVSPFLLHLVLLTTLRIAGAVLLWRLCIISHYWLGLPFSIAMAPLLKYRSYH